MMARRPARVAVVGAGLAGAAAAATAAAAGAEVVVLEARAQAGGASADSAGWIWRYQDAATFARHAPHGDPAVQRAIVDGVDDALAWLRVHGCGPLRLTGPGSLAIGEQHDIAAVIACLLDTLAPGALQLGCALEAIDQRGDGFALHVRRARGVTDVLEVDRVVLAGGGYAADLDRIALESGAPARARHEWQLRTHAGGDGSSQAAASSVGATLHSSGGACLVRAVPRLGTPASLDLDLLHAFGELTLPGVQIVDAQGAQIVRSDHDWSGAWGLWQLARTDGHGWMEIPARILERTTQSGSVAATVEVARAAGANVIDRLHGEVRIAIAAGITHTLGGLSVMPNGAVLGGPPGVYAAGCDARSAGVGGIASGLAQALVLGRAAARAASSRIG